MGTKKRTKKEHLAAVVIGNVGPMRAYRVMVYIASWGIATKKLGHPPVNVEEYADWWHKTRATAYREQELFREALPMHKTPTAICEWLELADPDVFKEAPETAAFKIGAVL